MSISAKTLNNMLAMLFTENQKALLQKLKWS